MKFGIVSWWKPLKMGREETLHQKNIWHAHNQYYSGDRKARSISTEIWKQKDFYFHNLFFFSFLFFLQLVFQYGSVVFRLTYQARK